MYEPLWVAHLPLRQNWFCQVELYGGKNSAINSVKPDATAFPHRDSLFTIQLYASKPKNAVSFPHHGFSFVDGMFSVFFWFTKWTEALKSGQEA